MGDDMRLKQIFWNVIKNAVKFTPRGGQIRVGSRVDQTAGLLLVTIADTGIGMTAEENSRIFAAFAQGDHAARGNTRFGGLGLGLAISRMLVQLHSGTISAQSDGRDRGAVFTIEFPLATDAPASEVTVNGHAPVAINGSAHHSPKMMRVLLVEDHEPTCRTLADLLSRRNYSVVTATSVAQARQAADAERFDLIISDVGLPDGNGCELMTELKSRYGLSGIALTGYGMDDDLLRSHAAGFVTHLTKPVSVQALDQALSSLPSSANGKNGNGVHGVSTAVT
jgi:CheY-like chemotaxis protein